MMKQREHKIRTDRIRQYCIWLWLLSKRLLKQPAFIGLLLLVPILGCAVGVLEQEDSGGAVVAVCVEKSEWSEQILSKLQDISASNPEGSSVLQYEFYDSDMEVQRAVLMSEADCGFVIAEDIAQCVKADDWHKSISVYETASSSITGMAKERIAGVIFQLYSENCYREYMEAVVQSEDFAAEYDPEEIVSFAGHAYETHLADGSTFSFVYRENDDDPRSQYNGDTGVGNDTSVFPIKGVFAVLIFISGMCGMLEYEKDKKEKRFLRLAPNWMTYIVNIWIPTVFTSLAVLLCLWMADALQYHVGDRAAGGTLNMGAALLRVWKLGMWCQEIAHFMIYQCIIVLYCSILRVILRRQETIAAAIPILTLGSLVCAPVFIRLAMYIPLFGVLEKLFPVTYYLML
ncbi:MAG: hypothetical protein J6K48_00795 [Lachnospiraceae bacterium]|nr:hypothetical protein [Lachnospiraceae bacterium]